jgi:enoyl-CoA hydratase
MYESYKALKIERRGKILNVTMNNPPLNPMTSEMHNEMSRIFFDINRDKDTKVVVLTGAGKAFSAGGDISNMKKRLDAHDYSYWLNSMGEAKNIVTGALQLERPLITRVNGHAMGLGATLAVLGDFSYMLEGGKIADTHVKVGLTAGDGGSLIWPFLVGFTKAKQHLLTGDPLGAKEAVEAGLIMEYAATVEELDAKVNAMADKLAAGAGYAVNMTKASINLVLRSVLDRVIETHLGWETQAMLHPDHHEAVNAFIEKREPKFA